MTEKVGGGGRLTDKIIDKMQNFYGQAIRNNIGDKAGMINDVWAIFKHIITDDLKTLDEQHSNCPKDPDSSWCKYWSDRNEYHENNRLPSIFIKELKPIFEALTEGELLDRCLKGLTQNQNEALNGVLWSRCPKTRFVGRKRVILAVCEAINQFNSGAGNKVQILEEIGLPISAQAMFGFQKEDESRVKVAEKKVSVESRGMRRKLRAKRKSKGETKTTYFKGGFGLSKEPEIDLDGNGKIQKPKTTKRKAKAPNQPTLPVSKENVDPEPETDSEDDIPLKAFVQVKITFVSDLSVKMITLRK